jgi:hypothetical protein
MSKLKNIVLRLSETEYQQIVASLSQHRAENLLYLFKGYRANVLTDAEIATSLGISMNAFYVLKSRLNDRIQENLSGDVYSGTGELFQQLQRVPELCLETPREIAVTTLEKLEHDLQQFDLHQELLVIYSGLKKIHLHTKKYYHYSQLYNKHAGFHLAMEKCEELLGTFNRYLAAYDLSRLPHEIEPLKFVCREVEEHLTLQPSRQIRIIRNLMHIQLMLCVGDEHSDDDVHTLLEQTEQEISQLPPASAHKKWIHGLNCLFFEYWVRERQPRRAAPYYEKVMGRINSILLFSPVVVTSRFLMSRLNYLQLAGDNAEIAEELAPDILTDLHDSHAGIVLGIARAMTAYFQGNYKNAATKLNKVLDAHSFKDHPHALAEVKLVLAFCYLEAGDEDMSKMILKSLTRKIKTEQPERYRHALSLIRVLLTGVKHYGPTEKQQENLLLFFARNIGDVKMLTYLEQPLKTRFKISP